jgi:hypothetical protein
LLPLRSKPRPRSALASPVPCRSATADRTASLTARSEASAPGARQVEQERRERAKRELAASVRHG